MEAEPPSPNRSSTAMTDLNVDTLTHCASFLDFRDISNMAMSCKYFNRVAYSDSIWRSFYRQEWPRVEPLFPEESSIREAYLRRRTTLNQFKYIDPQFYEAYIGGNPPQNLLINKKAIILSQGPSIYSMRNDDLLRGSFSSPLHFHFEACGNHNARVTCMRLYSRIEANQCQNETKRDDNILVTSSSDHSIRQWSKPVTLTWGGNRCFKGHTGPVLTLSDKLLGDDTGKIFASGGEDGTVRLWSINSSGKRGQQALKATLYGHEKAVPLMSVAGHKASLLVSISKNGKVRVWDTATATSSSRSSCCVGMTCVPVAPVGMKCHESLVYVAATSSVIAIDLRTMHKAFSVAQEEKVQAFDLLPSKSLLCTGGTGRANLWDMRRISGTHKVDPTAEFQRHAGPVKHIHMDPYKIVTGGPYDNRVNVWEVETGKLSNSLLCFAPEAESSYDCAAMAVDGCRIVTAGAVDEIETAVVMRDFRSAVEYLAYDFSSDECDESSGVSKFWDPNSGSSLEKVDWEE